MRLAPVQNTTPADRPAPPSQRPHRWRTPSGRRQPSQSGRAPNRASCRSLRAASPSVWWWRSWCSCPKSPPRRTGAGGGCGTDTLSWGQEHQLVCFLVQANQGERGAVVCDAQHVALVGLSSFDAGCDVLGEAFLDLEQLTASDNRDRCASWSTSSTT